LLCEPPAQAANWLRKDLPSTNIQVVDEHGCALVWQDDLRVLATWVDAQARQSEVT
jgi:hypothetical protein